ncbi:hypothetical protein C8N46_101250 [Kordia periserrulae]|uniref:Uncharacterized protein n=1 Tax=Kordia periserrulae TaxID=701523 RepID=A0A2T6C5Q1_9FLAO|nr:hypothetical protein [Kordia periserrulae]PTX63648.1 hypothetical protein C8N46_101250 [Kordia periserrulae]
MKSPEIKQLLEERRMEVSEQSWETLAARLDANDRQKRSKKMYIPYAACLALLIGWIVFSILRSETAKVEDVIANEELPVQKKSKPIITPQKEINPTKETDVVVTEQIVNTEKQVTKQVKELQTDLQKEVQQTVVVQEKAVPQKLETVIQEKEIIVASNDELKASIASLFEKEERTVTDAEIDYLLKEAQASLKHLKVKEEKVNDTHIATAEELLNEVEHELDKSFKQRVFELVKRNLQRTRTADIEQ